MQNHQKSHIKILDSMRGIAFLLVFMAHMFQSYSQKYQLKLFDINLALVFFSNYGLYLFFVLSGYLLFKPFVLAIETNHRVPSVKKYMYRRIARIYPNYLF